MTIDYTKTQKIIHWLMAIIIMLDLNVAQKFGGNMELWDRLESRADHATAGMIVTFLFIIENSITIFLWSSKTTINDACLAGCFCKIRTLFFIFSYGRTDNNWNINGELCVRPNNSFRY